MSLHLKSILIAALSLSLVACGGGGGGASGPLVSTDSFLAASAFKTRTDSGEFRSFGITGTQTVNGNAYHISGSGTLAISAAVPSTFEGQPALLINQALSGTVVVNGVSAPFSSTAQEFQTTSYAPFGIVTSGGYCVMQASSAIPAQVKVGDTGQLGAFTCYTDSSKTTVLSTGQLSYVIEAETEHTAIVNIIEKEFDNASTLQVTDQDRFRIDTFGTLTWVSESAKGPGYSYTFK